MTCATPALVIERAEEFFRPQGRGFTVGVREHVDADSLFAHPRRVFSPVTRFALATVDGEAAATAMVLLTGGMGGIYWVGTRPQFARRGLGTLCTMAVANAAFELGKPMVGLHSTPMGRAVYERMGFEHASSGHHWYVLT